MTRPIHGPLLGEGKRACALGALAYGAGLVKKTRRSANLFAPLIERFPRLDGETIAELPQPPLLGREGLINQIAAAFERARWTRVRIACALERAGL